MQKQLFMRLNRKHARPWAVGLVVAATFVLLFLMTGSVLVSAKALLDRNPHPTREEVVEAISGNICRCTGYHAIVDAVEEVAKARAGGA